MLPYIQIYTIREKVDNGWEGTIRVLRFQVFLSFLPNHVDLSVVGDIPKREMR